MSAHLKESKASSKMNRATSSDQTSTMSQAKWKDASQRIAEICRPFDPGMYQSLDLNRLAVYTLDLLSRNNILATFENIVVALFTMFPKKFSLVGFEHYPDSARVNRSLLQLRPKYRNWATGSPARGFRLTPAGLAVVDEIAKMLSTKSSSVSEVRSATKPRTLSPNIELERKVLGSSAYQKFSENRQEEIDKMEIIELLRAVPYAPFGVLSSYLRELENLAEEAKRSDVMEFLSFVRRKLRDSSSA